MLHSPRRSTGRDLVASLPFLVVLSLSFAGEADYYRIVTLSSPPELQLEVSGIATTPGGRVAIALRKGEVWWADGVTGAPGDVRYRRFASGLHEPLGLAWHDGALWLAQRAELSRLADTDGDDVADVYDSVASPWGVTGNYHEYAYGPVFDPEGNAWLTLNATLGKKLVKDERWRGWSIIVRPDRTWAPVTAGLRSPCGIGTNAAGDLFATDQQGEWIPTCSLVHLRPGVFHGHPASLADCAREESPLAHPGKVPSGLSLPEALERVMSLVPPAVWLPYRKAGQSSTDVLCDTTGGRFGPFDGQLFVGDFTLSLITRVALEKVDGEYQGACFPFRRGFQSAVLRLAWAPDGSLLVGETNRGWNSLGTRSFGFERLVWTGEVPFEIETMRARPDGFAVRLTKEVDPESAIAAASWELESYTYLYHATYGSPEIDRRALEVKSARLGDDGRTVELVVDGLREVYVHEVRCEGVRSREGERVLHPVGYYTLNRIPAGR